ncbi:MAG: hypothetical protein AAGJ83_06150 [Planctomycetota bacterium]
MPLSGLFAVRAGAAVLIGVMFCVFGSNLWGQVTTDAGLNDLVILDPGAHERGLPAVRINNLSDGQLIDIPPKVHVHRYFYSGDKIYQGPIIQGGPTVVVASHPKTGERLYIDVVLPPGAPRIEYTNDSITYVYSEKRVEIKFRGFPFDPCVAIVKHHSGKGVRRSVVDAHNHVREHVEEHMSNSSFVNSAKDVTREAHLFVKGVASGVGTLGSRGGDTLKQLSNLIPGVVYLKGMADQKPQRDYEAQIKNASSRIDAQLPDFVRTNR